MTPLKVGSLFSGIGGFDLAFQRAGFEIAWQVEIEPFCRRVLETRFPDAKRFNDITECGAGNLIPVDIICAGVPCQDVSVAGKRAGLAGERTGLFYEFARILRELRPAWFVFENVPGLLSSWSDTAEGTPGAGDGEWEELYQTDDFGQVLSELCQCGYGVAWRVLDSQFFGVAQRRRRVFIVGRFGAPCPTPILFEPEGRAGNTSQGAEAWPDIAAAITGGTGRSGSRGCDDGANIVSHALAMGGVSSGYRYDANGEDFVVANTLRESEGHHGRSSPRGDGCDNLVAAPITSGLAKQRHDQGGYLEHLIAAPLSAGSFDASHAPGRRREDDFNLVAYNVVGGGQYSKKHCYRTDRTGTIQSKGNSASGNEAGTVIATLNSGGNSGGFKTEPGEHIVIQGVRGGTRDKTDSGQGIGISEGGPCYTLSKTEQHAVAFQESQSGCREYENAGTLRANGPGHDPVGTRIRTDMSVRRLTPVECERLQGFPDGWSIPGGIQGDDPEFPLLPKGLDSARYRALGNAVTVNVVNWIARRIMNAIELESY